VYVVEENLESREGGKEGGREGRLRGGRTCLTLGGASLSLHSGS